MNSTPELIKERIKMQDIISKYDFHINRSGFMCCPFHNEKTPSLKIYPGGRGWYCYGCGAGGSVIDFVMRYFNLNLAQTIEKINSDFNLGVCTRPITTREKQAIYLAQQKREEERENVEIDTAQYRMMYNAINNEFRILNQAKPPNNPEEIPTLEFVHKLQKLEYLENWLDENNTFEKWRENYVL